MQFDVAVSVYLGACCQHWLRRPPMRLWLRTVHCSRASCMHPVVGVKVQGRGSHPDPATPPWSISLLTSNGSRVWVAGTHLEAQQDFCLRLQGDPALDVEITWTSQQIEDRSFSLFLSLPLCVPRIIIIFYFIQFYSVLSEWLHKQVSMQGVCLSNITQFL